jgi:hypothetical protein
MTQVGNMTQAEIEAKGKFTRAVCDEVHATPKECMQILLDLWAR